MEYEQDRGGVLIHELNLIYNTYTILDNCVKFLIKKLVLISFGYL